MIVLKLICLIILLEETKAGVSVSSNYRKATDKELQDLSEKLMETEVLNEGGKIIINLQNKIYSNTPSKNHLLNYNQNTDGSKEPDSYNQLQQLFKEYEKPNNPNLNKAISKFLDKIVDTEVMKETITFLNSHGIKMSEQSLKDYLDEIWFTPYKRGKGIQSSGFQHVFMAELKNEQVQGLHNWLFYKQEQQKGTLKYIGWSKHAPFKGYPASIVKIQFLWQGKMKPAGSLFLGTSPELEFALYTLCFIYRPEVDCNISLGSVPINIKTYIFTWNNQQLIASAFPVI